MHFQNSILAGLALAATARAHMKMSKPVPYGDASLNNSPLAASGSDFPCKLRGADTFDATGVQNILAVGSTQPLEFIGGATHGGGSCQVSVTYDTQPNKDSVWKVIHSIEGGCPVRNNPGNIGGDPAAPDPDTYSFTVPPSLKAGDATLAWTWFNKVGNREMYMNCAPITVTGSSATDADFAALPDMFVANVGNGCGTTESVDLVFPNAGASVERLGTGPLGPPTGSCPAGAAAAAGGSSSGSPSSSPPVVSPGVFATVPVSPAPAATQPAAAPPSAAAPAPAPASPSAQAPAPAPAPAAASPAPAAPAASPPPSTSSSAGAQTGACAPEGQWNCIGGTSFQRCASGSWSVVQALAAGTSCAPGIGANIDMVAPARKRAVRFSNEHIHRHVRRSS